MSIPYLPGWWDEISKSATGFVQQLPEHIQPQRVAQKKLEEMIRQDPTVLSKLGNMDDSTRALFEQTMRLAPGTVTGLAPGFERQKEEEMLGAIGRVRANPVTAPFRDGVLTGTPVVEDITRRREADQIDLETKKIDFGGAVQDRELKTLLGNEQKRIINQLNQYRQQYPELDVNGIVRGIATGKMTPELQQQMMVAMQDNPALIQSMLGIYEMNARFGQDIFRRGQDNSAELGRVAVNAASLAQRDYRQAQTAITNWMKANKIAPIDLEKALKRSPAYKTEYDLLVKQRDEAKTTYDQWVPVTKRMFGVEAEKIFTPLEEEAPVEDEATRILREYRERLGRRK